MPKSLVRCAWAEGQGPDYVAYHDTEWGVPVRDDRRQYEFLVLEGAHGDGSRSAMRKPGWETLPRGAKPILVDGWYPPGGVPSATTVDIQGDKKPEIIAPFNDGFIRA